MHALPTTPIAPRVNSQKVTPQKRASGSGPSKSIKDRLSIIVQDGARCLLTRRPSGWGSITVCHLIPRATDSHELDFLEHVLGYELKEGHNLDSTSNLIYLDHALHTSFDSNYWGLLPPPDIVNEILEWLRVQREKAHNGDKQEHYQKSSLPKTCSRYRIVAGSKAARGVIKTGSSRFNQTISVLPMRIHRVMDDEKDLEQRFDYPFTNFPPISSHCHPLFALLNAIPKFEQWDTEGLPRHLLVYEDLVFGIRDELDLWREEWEAKRWQELKTRKDRTVVSQSSHGGRFDQRNDGDYGEEGEGDDDDDDEYRPD